MTTEKSQNVQDVFLNHVRKNKTPVTVFLVNGVKLQGIITWFDNFCVLLRRDAHSQLVYKHAISTVMPAQPIQLFEGGKEAASSEPHREPPIRPRTEASTSRALVVHPAREICRPAAAPEATETVGRGPARRGGRAGAGDRPRCRARRDRPRRAAACRRPCSAAAMSRHLRGMIAENEHRARRRRRDAVARCSSATSNGAGRPRSSTAPG